MVTGLMCCVSVVKPNITAFQHTNHGRKMWISPRSSLSHVLTPPWWSVTILQRLSFPQFGTMHVLEGWLVVVGDGQFMFRLHQERIGPQLPWPWVLGPPASKLLPLKVRGPDFPKWPMSWQRAAISKEYLSQRNGMQWVMATWCLKITQRLPLPACGGHNPDAIHCRCIRTLCHAHWFAMTRRCIFMTGTLGVLEIFLLFY